MQTCSKEFILKHSKPKISSTPTKSLTSSMKPMDSFEVFTMKSKIIPYNALASASRLSEAVRTVTGLRTFSFITTRFWLQSDPSNNDLATPVSLAASSIESEHSCMAWEPSLLPGGASNRTLPKCRTAAMTLKMSWMSSAAMPMVCIALMRRSNISTSSLSFKTRQVDFVRYAKLPKSLKPSKSTSRSALILSFESTCGYL
mmetsp:Transcript_46024/g.118187  ORF Transcript_46024/g.118187 Transcript_46024/m.118187 type:complete len:201 (-) Transcript_46024:91-693(-)